jgi:hypothetical protein
VLQRQGLAGEFVSLWCETLFPRHARVGRSVRDWLLLAGRRRLRFVLWGGIAVELRGRMTGIDHAHKRRTTDLVRALAAETETTSRWMPGLAFAVRLWQPVAEAWGKSPLTLITAESAAFTGSLLDDWLTSWAAPVEIVERLKPASAGVGRAGGDCRSSSEVTIDSQPVPDVSHWMQAVRMVELLSPRLQPGLLRVGGDVQSA